MKSAFLRNSHNQCQTALFSFDIKRVPVFRFTPKKGGSENLKKEINVLADAARSGLSIGIKICLSGRKDRFGITKAIEKPTTRNYF